MELSAIIKRQIAADERRGFPVRFDSEIEQYDQLSRDLIGLLGEVGEFANQIKRLGLKLSNARYNGPNIDELEPNLREELADAAIYLFRLSAIIGGDLEKDILAKMDVNDERYRHLEQ